MSSVDRPTVTDEMRAAFNGVYNGLDYEDVGLIIERVVALAAPVDRPALAGAQDEPLSDYALTIIAACRDAFPPPPPGSDAEAIWAQAIGDPESVPDYLRALAALSGPTEGSEPVASEGTCSDGKPHDWQKFYKGAAQTKWICSVCSSFKPLATPAAASQDAKDAAVEALKAVHMDAVHLAGNEFAISRATVDKVSAAIASMAGQTGESK